ncbi:rhomboid family intramembrane serine protease [Peteryoungia desertarenae]|uniref:Rhomboid family intramembrane serine protease n=2 Tax=Peteryoungia desertarenae TaxID=1813451 RepID=A0ABX6QT61_9HYPH|nr:rhomboid family intramembrane serine protease [Peteryoungia desertarenae]
MEDEKAGEREAPLGHLDQGHGPDEPPVFNIPKGIVYSLILLAGIYTMQNMVLGHDLSDWLTFELAFSPIRYLVPFSQQSLAWLWTPVTYSLLHGSLEHLAFNSLWLAAFGTPVYRRIGPIQFIALWIVSAAAGAGLHAYVNWGEPTLMVGASGVVSAFMGGACRFAFVDKDRRFLRHTHHEFALLGIGEALSQRNVRVFVLVWFAINIAIAFGMPLFGSQAAIAWDAHIGGFLLGFLGFSSLIGERLATERGQRPACFRSGLQAPF